MRQSNGQWVCRYSPTLRQAVHAETGEESRECSQCFRQCQLTKSTLILAGTLVVFTKVTGVRPRVPRYTEPKSNWSWKMQAKGEWRTEPYVCIDKHQTGPGRPDTLSQYQTGPGRSMQKESGGQNNMCALISIKPAQGAQTH
eukprot:1160002-Pelagomonas_calceolata.AAC.21